MRVIIRVKDIIDVMVFGEYRGCMEKYNLDQRKLDQIKQALVNGKWNVA